MKIADSDSIKAGEQELISSIMEKLNPETLSRMASKTFSPEQMEFIRGDMVIRDNRIVYKMDFKVTLDVSVMFDRDGELVSSDEEDDDSGFLQEESLEPFSEEWDDPSGEVPLDEGGITEPEEDEEPQSAPVEDDMAHVLTRTRDFWRTKGEEALHEVRSSEEQS